MFFIKKYRLVLLALLSGLLFALSWPARGVPLIIFVAFIPLFIAEDEIFRNRQKFSKYTVLLLAWLAFAIFNALTTWWIVFASVPGVIMAVFLNSFFMAIPFFLMHWARRVLPGKQGLVSLLIFWLSFEFLHLDWDLSWSWLNLGNVFASLPQLVQWYEFTGTLGGTAWIIVMNICLFALYTAYQKPLRAISVDRTIEQGESAGKKLKESFVAGPEQLSIIRQRFFAGLATIFFLLVPTIISIMLWSRYEMPAEKTEVVVVQPGRDPYRKPENLQQLREWTDSIVLLAERHITTTTRFVVVPEGSLPGALWLNDPQAHYGFSKLYEHAAGYDSLAWVAGVMMYRQYNPGDEIPASARKFSNADQYYDVFNAALFIDSEGNTDTYFKSKLVPGIERMPFSQYLGPLGNLVEYFGGTSGSMGTQNTRGVFTGPDGTRVAPVICYESIYGAYLSGYIRNGAQLILIITNDGWWRNTAGYRQHNQYARLRAIETRRSVARAAKTGISGFIDPRGTMLQQTEWWVPDAIVMQIPKNDKLTFYVRNGDFLGRLSVFLLVLLLLYMFTQGVLKKKRL